MSEWKLGQLVIRDDEVAVPGDGEQVVVQGAEALFEHTRTDALGRYRPLTGAKTLLTGWIAPVGEELPADQAIETVYPLALVHRRQLAEGTLRVVALEDVLSRQTGRYEDSARLSVRGRNLAVRVVCGACVRKPLWDGAACGAEDIPCPEPCSVMVAFCREAALWQGEPPAPTGPDESVAWAAFEEPGNELRERYLREWSSDDE